jgi:hypothetical protein
MNCLRSCAGIVAPETPAVPVPTKLPLKLPPRLPVLAHAGLLDIVVVGEVAGVSVAMVGTAGLGLTVLPAGKTLGSGTAGVELTPRLPISNDPNGIPVRALPPGTVGAVDVGALEVGADDAARLLEPAPHIPDIPDVSSVPDDAALVSIPDVDDVAEVDVADIAVVPEFAAVAGAAAPIPIPPPSKLAVEPNISEGEVAPAEHCVLVVVVGIVIVPVTPLPGVGLSPGEVISVAPNGIPVGEPADPVATPSGEVAPIIGVGVTVPPNSSPT